MPSKSWSSWKVGILPTIAALLLLSCSYFFDQKDVVTEVNYNQDTSASCITKANNGLRKYFDVSNVPEMQAVEIDYIAECYQNSIQSFVKHTESGREDSENYTIENIELLINKFHPGIEVSQEKIGIYLRLKQFFFGGQAEILTITELKNIAKIVPVLNSVLKTLLPHRGIVFHKQKLLRDVHSYDKFTESFQVLHEQSSILLRALDPYSGPRKMDLWPMAAYFINGYYDGNTEHSDKYLPAAMGFKNLVLNSEGTELDRRKLNLLVEQSFSAGEALSKFSYFVQDDFIFTNIGFVLSFMTKIQAQLKNARVFQTLTLKAVLEIFDTGESILMRSTEQNQMKEVGIDKVGGFLEGLGKAGFFSGNLTPNTLTIFIDNMSKKWLDPQAKRITPNITQGKLKYLKKLMTKWFYRQQYINSHLLSGDPEKVQFPFPTDGLNSNPELTGWLKVFDKTSLHQWNRDNRVIFSKLDEGMSYGELTVANSLTILIELFMKPYNLEVSDPLEFTLFEFDTEGEESDISETQEIYEAMRILGVEMKIMDSREFNSGKKSFMEANNFTTQRAADDSLLNFYEAFELLSISLSSAALADYIHSDFNGSCERTYPDVHGYKVLEADCFGAHLFKNFSKYFNQLDTVNHYWESATYKEKRDFLDSLEYAARGGIISPKPVDVGEIRVMCSILYYLESIFYVFELPNSDDGIATGQEIENAEWHFRPLIKSIIEKNNKDDVDFLYKKFEFKSREAVKDYLAPRVFLFLLNGGKLPIGKFKFARIYYLYDNTDKANADLKATVADVLKVFGETAKSTHDNWKKTVTAFVKANHQNLFDALADEEPPICRDNRRNVFCQWSRIINCNENINPDLYDWMHRQRYKLFSESAWAEDSDEAAATALGMFNQYFPDDQKFSTLCNFPRFSEDPQIVTPEGSFKDLIQDDEGGKTNLQKLKDMWDNLW